MKKIKKLVQLLVLVICLTMTFEGKGSQVQAISDLPKEVQDSLRNSTAKYMDSSQYTYWLDLEETGLLDSLYMLMNEVANGELYLVRMIGTGTAVGYYECMTLDVGGIFGDQINSIQSMLYQSIFKPLLWFGVLATGIKMIGRIWRRNLTAAAGDVMAMVLVMAMALVVRGSSGSVLTQVNQITHSISGSVIRDISNISEEAGYESTIIGILWNNMVHTPWKQLEFFEQKHIDEELADTLMGVKRGETRRAVINALVLEGETAFDKHNGLLRFFAGLLYFFMCLGKMVIFLLCGSMQAIYQAMTVFLIFLGPIILLLSLFPGYDLKVIAVWLRKLLSYQVSAIAVSMFTAFLLAMDNYLMQSSENFLVSACYELVVLLGIFMFRKQIFKMIDMAQRTVQNPGTATRTGRSGGGTGRFMQAAGSVMRYKRYRTIVKKLSGGRAGAAAGKRKSGTGVRPKTDDNKDAAKEEAAEKKQTKNQTDRAEEQDAKWEEKKQKTPRPRAAVSEDQAEEQTGKKKNTASVPAYEEDDTQKTGRRSTGKKTGQTQTGTQGTAEQEKTAGGNTKKSQPAAEKQPSQKKEKRQKEEAETVRQRSNKRRSGRSSSRALNGGSVVQVEEKERKSMKRPTAASEKARKGDKEH